MFMLVKDELNIDSCILHNQIWPLKFFIKISKCESFLSFLIKYIKSNILTPKRAIL